MVNVALAGGGTAGHTSPLIATANALRKQDPEIGLVAIGTPKGLETKVIPEAGLDLKLIPPVPMPRKPTAELAFVPSRLAKAVQETERILTIAQADVVVGFGGYVAMPAYLAARRLKLPIVIHEQNSVPGLANKVAARLTKHVFTTYPDTPLRNSTCIGLPLRPEIATLDRKAVRTEARRVFGFDSSEPVLLVSGGSQGARSINHATEGAFPWLIDHGISVLHVLGRKNFDEKKMVPVTHAESGAIYKPVPYVDRMEAAYAAADLMLGRAGAGTVVETAVVGLPSILVPLPHGNGEQARNAESLVQAGGARLLADAACNAAWLQADIPDLITDRDELERMSKAGKDLMPADAAEVLASHVLAAAGEQLSSRKTRKANPGNA